MRVSISKYLVALFVVFLISKKDYKELFVLMLIILLDKINKNLSKEKVIKKSWRIISNQDYDKTT